MKTSGVISDTHGVLRPEAVKALRGVDRIIHAGDVGRRDILDALRQIAPVFAVRGVWYLNPGSAGPRRFHLPVSVALIRVTARGLQPQLSELKVADK